MSSPFAHTLGAYSFLVTAAPQFVSKKKLHWMAWLGAAALGSLADADFVIAHFTTHAALRHHYFSHSIPFALAFTLCTYVILRIAGNTRPLAWSLLIGIGYSTHLLLDFVTDDKSPPIGIPLLWPLTSEHFISPRNIFLAIHRGSISTLFGTHNLLAILKEFVIMSPVAFLAWHIAKKRVMSKEEAGKERMIAER